MRAVRSYALVCVAQACSCVSIGICVNAQIRTAARRRRQDSTRAAALRACDAPLQLLNVCLQRRVVLLQREDLTSTVSAALSPNCVWCVVMSGVVRGDEWCVLSGRCCGMADGAHLIRLINQLLPQRAFGHCGLLRSLLDRCHLLQATAETRELTLLYVPT